MTKDFEYYFKCLLTTPESSVENFLFTFTNIFLNCAVWFVSGYLLDFSVYILNITTLLDVEFFKDPFPLLRLLFCPSDSVCFLTEPRQFHEVPFINCWSYSLSHWYFVQKIASSTYAFKGIFQFLFYEIYCIRFYVEVFDPLRLEFCAG